MNKMFLFVCRRFENALDFRSAIVLDDARKEPLANTSEELCMIMSSNIISL